MTALSLAHKGGAPPTPPACLGHDAAAGTSAMRQAAALRCPPEWRRSQGAADTCDFLSELCAQEGM